MANATASQTIGPFWHLLVDPAWADLTRFGASGEKIVLHGRLTDGDDAPITDACVEIWQASPPANDLFQGFGRCASDADGQFRFITLKPAAVPGRGNSLQAPHIAVTLFARGILTGLRTRVYFAGETLNDTDPLLAAIEDPARRATLVAVPDGSGVWHIDIRLQGAGETVFLEV
ncbi:MAG TPA: protocatechuate 3,4-dioxygenase subunit alpha [Acetobacteraceae bacterium]|nr:protocatechuate 3,4-dioxygenase subunit alpha [Acetobacteraceae bacterium]